MSAESVEAAVTTAHCILVTANIVGNTLVCVIILKNREMRYAEIEIQNYAPQLTERLEDVMFVLDSTYQ